MKLTIALAGALALLLAACASDAASTPAAGEPAEQRTQITPATQTVTPSPATSTVSPTTLDPTLGTDTATPEAQVALWVVMAEIPADLPAYDRDDWKHWTDEDDDCQDTRQEVLLAESVIDVTYKDDKACRVVAGRWLTQYSAATVTDPGKLDVDHMVPLSNAHASGGWDWSPERKEQFANHLDDPQHLIAVTAGANRSKGAKGPDQWKPEDQAYWCRYAVDWVTIKHDWGLTVTEAEFDALVEMLDTCADSTVLMSSEDSRPAANPADASTPAPSPTPAQAAVYESCDAAQAAGEPRIQGSQGSGRGFPQEMVPSVGDGDGDGVVCER